MRRQWWAGELLPFTPAREVMAELAREREEMERQIAEFRESRGIPADKLLDAADFKRPVLPGFVDKYVDPTLPETVRP